MYKTIVRKYFTAGNLKGCFYDQVNTHATLEKATAYVNGWKRRKSYGAGIFGSAYVISSTTIERVERADSENYGKIRVVCTNALMNPRKEKEFLRDFT